MFNHHNNNTNTFFRAEIFTSLKKAGNQNESGTWQYFSYSGFIHRLRVFLNQQKTLWVQIKINIFFEVWLQINAENLYIEKMSADPNNFPQKNLPESYPSPDQNTLTKELTESIKWTLFEKALQEAPRYLKLTQLEQTSVRVLLAFFISEAARFEFFEKIVNITEDPALPRIGLNQSLPSWCQCYPLMHNWGKLCKLKFPNGEKTVISMEELPGLISRPDNSNDNLNNDKVQIEHLIRPFYDDTSGETLHNA